MCLAADGLADLINDVDPPVIVEVGVASPVEAQAVEIVVDEKPQPGAPDGTFNIQIAPPVGPNGTDAPAFIKFTPNGQFFATALAASGTEAVEPGKYWIGLLCVDPGDALRAQLGLGEGVGLLVEAVTDESPAKRAGIVQHDVLVTLNDKNNSTIRVLKQVKELIAEVQTAETKPLIVEVIRKGQRQMIEVVPAERPKPTEVRSVLGEDLAARLDRQPLGLRLAGPVFALIQQLPALPEGMTMEFHQVVGQPEKITVKKGEQTWELTESVLDKAPEEVRVAVLQQLAARRAGPVSQVISLPRTTAVLDAGWFNRALPLNNSAAADPNAQPTPPATQAAADARLQARAAEAAADDAARANLILHEVDLFNHLRVTGLSPLVVTATAMILPDDVTVAIVRKGAEPAKITVKKGEQTWDVTEKELGKLPEELRKHADSALRGQAPQAWKSMTFSDGDLAPMKSFHTIRSQLAPGAPGAYRVEEVQLKQPQPPTVTVVEQQMKLLEQQREQLEIREQLKKLNDKIEKLQQTLDKSAPKQ